MPVAYESDGGTVFAASNSNAAITVPLPATRPVGSILLMIAWSRRNDGSISLVTGPGWADFIPTFPKASGTVSGGSLNIWARLVDGSESAPTIAAGAAVTGNSGDLWGACIFCYSGVDTSGGITNILDGTPTVQDASGTTTCTYPALTISNATSMIVRFLARFRDAVDTFTPTATWNEREDIGSTVRTGAQFHLQDKLATASGAQASVTVAPSNTTAARYLAVTLALKPQPPPSQTGVAKISLAAAGTPVADSGHAIKVRARVTSGAGVIKAALYEGANNRSGDLTSSALTTSLAEYSLPISEANAANITSYSNLDIWLWGYSSGGGAIVYEVDQVWLETPASAGTPINSGDTGIGLDSAAITGISHSDTGVGTNAQLANSNSPSVLFDGSDDRIVTSVGGANINGNFMCVAIVKRDFATADREVVVSVSPTWRFGIDNNARLELIGDTVSLAGATMTALLPSQGWVLIAVTKTTGTVTARFHKYVFATQTWLHVDATTAEADWGIDASSAIYHGRRDASFYTFPGNILISGVWASNFSDSALEALGLQDGLQEWVNANPLEGWRFNANSGIAAFGSNGTADQTGATGTTIDADGPTTWSDEIVTPVFASDTGTGIDSATISVPVSSSDTGAGVNNQTFTVVISAADVNGVVTEATGAIAQKYVSADSGTSTEAASIAVPISASDANVITTEAVTLKVVAPSSDIGTDSEAVILVARITVPDTSGVITESGTAIPTLVSVSSNDVGLGTDAQTLTAAYTSAEIGNTVDAITNRKTDIPEIAVGVDSQSLITPGAAADNEIGSGVDAATVTKVVLTATEAGTDVEATTLVALISTPDVNGAITESTRIALVGADTATAVESAAISAPVSASDTGTGVEAISVFRISVADTGTDSEAATRTAALSFSDSAIGIEAQAQTAQLTATDSGTAVETTSAGVPISTADSAIGTDSASIVAATPKSSAQTAVGVDSATVTKVVHLTADTAISTQATSLSAALSDLQTGSGSDSASMGKVSLTTAESGLGIEQRILAAILFDYDVSIGIDVGLLETGYIMQGDEAVILLDARIDAVMVDAVITGKLTGAGATNAGTLVDAVITNGKVEIRQLSKPSLTNAKVE